MKELEKLYDSLTSVDDRFILEASQLPEICEKKHSVWRTWGMVAACLGIVFMSAVVFFTGKINSPVDTTVIDMHTEEQANPQEDSSLSHRDPVSISMSSVFVNELSDVQTDASRLWRDPDFYEEVTWNENAIVEYYGKNPAPAYIPEGLYPARGNGIGHVYVQKSDGKVAEDQVWLGYYHAYQEDGSPRLTDDAAAPKGFHLRASKLGLLNCCIYILPENEVKASDIGGIPVTIGYRPMPYGPYDAVTQEPAGVYDLYVAEFEFEGISYQIVAEQMELEEVVKIVTSIIFGEQEILVQE